MTQRSAFQIQILEKLGAPLLKAVGAVAAQQGEGGDQKQEAERVAALLSKTIQVSIGLAGSMDIKGAEGESMRLALAAMAGPLIAGQYRATGKVPGEGDLKRMIKALEAVLTFSDSFVPGAENTMRLENIAPGSMPADEGQVSVQYISSLVPVVSAVAAFPFGQPENKLVQEVAGRLVATAERIGRTLLNGSTDEQARKRAELQILKALADIYVECHEVETARLLQMDESARARATEKNGGALSMEPVWEAFDRRAGMMEVLGRGAGPDSGARGDHAPAAPPPPVQEQVSAPPVQAAEAPPQTGGSPLAMFAKKPAGAVPPPQEMPQAYEPLPVQPEAPYQPPPAQPPQESASSFATFAPQNDGDEEGGGAPNVDSAGDGGAYNPMSFFRSNDAGNRAGDEQEDL